MSVADRLIGQVLADAFRLTRRVAIGAVGMIYEAEEIARSRRVAVKLLHPSVSRDPAALASHQREARTVGALRHPHVAEFVDFSPPDAKGAFIVTELLDGEDLGAYLVRVRRLSVRAAVSITRDLLAALDAAHNLGVVHRDLHPRNVFLCRRGGRSDHVKVVDFGVANLRGTAGATSTTRAQGAARYLAPEQAHGEQAGVDARVDVWAAGVLLYEMLTGSPAFAGPDRAAILARIAEQEPAAVHTLRAEVRPDLEAVVTRALAKAPAGRFPSARAMREALAAAARSSGDWADEVAPPLAALTDPFADVRTVPQELAPGTEPPPLPPLPAVARAPQPAAPDTVIPRESTVELSMDDIESVASPPPLPPAAAPPDESPTVPAPLTVVEPAELAFDGPVWRRPGVVIAAVIATAATLVLAGVLLARRSGPSTSVTAAAHPDGPRGSERVPAPEPTLRMPTTVAMAAVSDAAPGVAAVAASPDAAPVSAAAAVPATEPAPASAPGALLPPLEPASRPATATPRTRVPPARSKAPAALKHVPSEERSGRLSRDKVRKVMEPLGRQVKACFRNFNVTKGHVALSLTIAPSGQVTRAATTGRYAGTPAGGCAATAARRAAFPAFGGAPMTISYGYELR